MYLISLVRSAGDPTLPVHYRVYDKPVDGLTKDDHFREMALAARRRGFRPRAVPFENWYSGLDDLKLVPDRGWVYLTQWKVNRRVDPDRAGYRAVGGFAFGGPSLAVRPEGLASVRVFRVVPRDVDTD